MIRTLEDCIALAKSGAWDQLIGKEVCQVLDSAWGLNMMRVGFAQMMKGEDKLTPKQHREKHGYEGKLFD
jgi:hypothetical protein